MKVVNATRGAHFIVIKTVIGPGSQHVPMAFEAHYDAQGRYSELPCGTQGTQMFSGEIPEGDC